MVEPVRIALVGYGFGGRFFHAPLLASVEECDFVGVVTKSGERRALVAEEHPAVTCFDDLEQLVSAGVEAVAISTPAMTHSALTDQALELGLHVVCDKPFAMGATEATRSSQLAERCGLVLSPFQNRRWDSDFLTVRQLVDQGRLGELRRFESRFERMAPDNGPGASGGGTLLDFGSHLVDQAHFLLGPVREVYAEWRLRDSGLDDDVFVALTHESGARSHLWGSWSQAAPGARFRASGTVAAYTVDGPMDGQEAALVAGDSPATLGSRWGVEPDDRWGTLSHADGSTEVVASVPGAWQQFYSEFASAIRGSGPVPVPVSAAIETATILGAARRSATDRTVVTL